MTVGLPVPAAIEATLAWINGDSDATVFRGVDAALATLDLPVVSMHRALEKDRLQALAWFKAVGRAAAKHRATPKPNGPAALVSTKIRGEVWAELAALTGAFALQPKLTYKGVEYGLVPTAFVKSTPLTWSALAAAELMTDPDRFHFLMCPGCERLSVDIRQGKGKRRGRFCSKRCQDRVGQREWRSR